MTVSTLNPTVGIVVTDWPSFNLYKMARQWLRFNAEIKDSNNDKCVYKAVYHKSRIRIHPVDIHLTFTIPEFKIR